MDDKSTIQLSDKKTSAAFDEKMQEMEHQQKERMVQVQASMLGVPYINLEKFPIPQETLKLIPKSQAMELHAMPFYHTSAEIRVAAIRPGTPEILKLTQDLQKQFNVPVHLYITSEHSFEIASKLFDKLPKIKKVVKGVEITEDELQAYGADIRRLSDLQNKILGVNVSDMVTALIAMGLQMRASDIHIESEEEDVKIRYRIDGVLHDAAVLSHDTFPKISNRIKLLSRLKLNVVTEPQDGRFTIYLTDDKIDVRVSTLPTSYGESIVMRILKASAAGLKFEDLGLRGSAYKRLEKETLKPNGMIITTGPTGSGKTTTLYSILLKLNTPETKIITLEDPIEYKLEGINQSQVDKKRNYDFSGGLRAILRQDPDVIMVGEIRDFETADTAINASLTGHLVISTLHTNSAAGAIPRFLSMGVKPFLLSPSLNAIIGQRLVRRVCSECKHAQVLDAEMQQQVMEILSSTPDEDLGEYKGKSIDELTFFVGAGCDACNGLGYRGRVGIYEIMTMTKEIEAIISSETISEYAIQEIAVKQGMVSMVQDGVLKTLEGLTTLEEVFRVAQTLQ